MSSTPDGTTPGTVPSKPGILFVSSQILNPTIIDPGDFCNWYENTHIQEVQSTGGISSSQRYESLAFIGKHRPDATSGAAPTRNLNFNYDFLTVYNMPDLAFRESEAFRGLDGQSRPDEVLLEKVFKQTEFLTRFCEEVGVVGSSKESPNPAPCIITAGTTSNDALASFSKLPGYRRAKKYSIREASLLSAFQRSYVNEPSDLTIFEFDAIPDNVEGVLKEIQWVEGLEIAFWHLRREYAGTERTPAKWEAK